MEPVIELLRPWKLATLARGIALLIAGRFYYQAPDWDVQISLIMASIPDCNASVTTMLKAAIWHFLQVLEKS